MADGAQLVPSVVSSLPSHAVEQQEEPYAG
jgi:hypothetical protein